MLIHQNSLGIRNLDFVKSRLCAFPNKTFEPILHVATFSRSGGENMSILDSVTNMAKGGGDHAAVAGGLLEELGGTGGIAGLIQSFHQNGAGGLIQQWASGQTQNAD